MRRERETNALPSAGRSARSTPGNETPAPPSSAATHSWRSAARFGSRWTRRCATRRGSLPAISSAASQFDELLQRLGSAFDVYRASALLGWDEETKMPPQGAAARAE